MSNLKLEIPPQLLDVFGNALTIAAKHGPDSQTGVFVQAWAWLNSATQKAVDDEQKTTATQSEASVQARIESAIKEAKDKENLAKCANADGPKKLSVEK